MCAKTPWIAFSLRLFNTRALGFRAPFCSSSVTPYKNSRFGLLASSGAPTANEIDYTFINKEKAFIDVCHHLGQSSTLAFDIECEFNQHRYGTHLCLVQVSDGNNIFILDPTAIGDLDPLWRLLENEDIEVIVHSPGSDISLLDKLYGRRPSNLFCTEMAARLLGYQQLSLAYLLEKHCGHQKQGKLSIRNWFQRPLSKEMLQYAALDVACLHQLKAILRSELDERGRLQWHKEECVEMEHIRHQVKEKSHLRIKGAKGMSKEEAHVLKHLFQVREAVAKNIDRPPFYIISNKQLVQLAQQPPVHLQTWKSMKRVHPRVREQDAIRFHQATIDAKASIPEPIQTSSIGDIFIYDERKAEILELIRAKIHIDYPDIGNLVLSKRVSHRVAVGKITLLDLRNWRRTIVFQIGKELGLDMSLFG